MGSPVLLDLDLLAQDEWTPVLERTGAELGTLEEQISALTASLGELNGQVSSTAAPLNETAAASTQAAAGLDQQAASVDALVSVLAPLQEQIAALTASNTALAESNAALAEANAGTAEALTGSTAATEANAAALDANTAAVDVNTEAKAGNAAASTNAGAANERMAGGLINANMAAMLATAGIAALEFETVKLGSSLDVADAKLVSFAGVSQSAIGGLNQQMLDLTRQTGEAPKKVADGLYFAVSAGFAASDAMKILADSTHLAAAAQTDAKTVVDVTTSALKAYGMAASDTAHVQDVLVATTVAGKMEFADLAGSLGRLLPIAAQAHVPLEQVGAAIATMTQKGLSADEAVTAVRGLLLNLEAPSKQTRDALAEVGLTVDQVRASIADPARGLLPTLTDLIERSGGNLDSLHQLIPNVRALAGAMADAGSTGRDYQEALDSITNSHGKAAAAWDTYEKTAAAAAERFKGTVVAAMTEAGLGIVKGLEPGMQAINNLLGLLDSTGPGGRGGIAQGVSFIAKEAWAMSPLGQLTGEISGGQALAGDLSRGDFGAAGIQAAAEGLRLLPIFGGPAAGVLDSLAEKFQSGSTQSQNYAAGVKAVDDALLQFAQKDKNPLAQMNQLDSQFYDFQHAMLDALQREDIAKQAGDKTGRSYWKAIADRLRGEMDQSSTDFDNLLRDWTAKRDKALSEGNPDSFLADEARQRRQAGDTLQNPDYRSPGAPSTAGVSGPAATGTAAAIADVQRLYDIMQRQVPAVSIQQLKNDLAEADSDILRTTTDLNKLLNAPTAAQDATNLKLMEAQRIIDGYDTAIANAVPNSQHYNDLVKQRGDYFNQVVAPLQAAQRSEGDMANAVKVVNDMYDRGRLSASDANAELDKLTTTTDQYGKTVVTVSAADSAQVQALRDKITAHENEKGAIDSVAQANAVLADLNDQLLVPSIKNVGSAAQGTAGVVQGAAADMNTELQGVGNVSPDLGPYQSALVSQATSAGAAAAAAISAQLQHIAATVAVNVGVNIQQALTGGGSSGGPAAAAAPATGGGGGGGNVEGLFSFDENVPLGLNDLLSFSASGPRPPTVPGAPKPAPIHIAPSAPTAAKGGGGSSSGGASSASRAQAQGIAAAHSAMSADVQSIQQELQDALAEFDALINPGGKNALVARLTADLTNPDSVAGIADAERVLFREAIAQGGGTGAAASADQIVNAWFSAASKGITDPAKLDELRGEAQKLLQALGDAMPDVAAASSASKGIDLAASLFSGLGSPDSVKTLSQQVVALIQSGRPDAEEAIRHLLFGDGVPTAKQAADAAKVAQAVRDMLIKGVDPNDPQAVQKLLGALQELQAVLQAQANKQGVVIPVTLGDTTGTASAGIPGLIPVPAEPANGISGRSALGGLGGFTPGLRRGQPAPEPAAPAEPETPDQAAARVIAQGQPRTDAAIEDELAQQVADLVLQGKQFEAIQVLVKAGSQEAIQRVVEKAVKIIQASSATATQQVQALGELGVAKSTAIGVTPVVSTNTSAEDKAADTQAQAALNPGSASSRIEQSAQTLAQLIEKGDPGSAQQYLSRIPKADFQQVVSRAREIIKADAEKNHTTAADLAAENRDLNKAETAAAPTAANNLSPEEQAKLQEADYKLKHSPEYYSSKEAVASSDAITARRLANPGSDFQQNAAGPGTLFRYGADAAMESQRAADEAYKRSIDQLTATIAAETASRTSQPMQITLRNTAVLNGRAVGQWVDYAVGRDQQFAQRGGPTSGSAW